MWLVSNARSLETMGSQPRTGYAGGFKPGTNSAASSSSAAASFNRFVQADVALAPLHLAHERPVQIGNLRQPLLAQAQHVAPRAYPRCPTRRWLKTRSRHDETSAPRTCVPSVLVRSTCIPMCLHLNYLSLMLATVRIGW